MRPPAPAARPEPGSAPRAIRGSAALAGPPGELAPVPSVRRALSLATVNTVAARVLGAMGGLVVARLLGPPARGSLALLVLLATAGQYLASTGLELWAAREIARRGAPDAVDAVLRRHVALAALIALALGAVCAPVLDGPLGVGTPDVVLAFALAVAMGTALVALARPTGMRAMGIVAVGNVGAALVYVTGAVALLALDVPSIAAILGFAIAGRLLAAVIGARFRRGRSRPSAPPTRHEAAASRHRDAMRFGAPLALGEVIQVMMMRIDIFVVAAFLPLEAVGLYAVAVSLTGVVFAVFDATAIVVLPTTARDPRGAPTARLLALAGGFAAGVALVLTVFSHTVVEGLFGAPYRDAAQALPLLAVAAIAAGSWKILAADVVGRGATRPRVVSVAIGLVTMLAVDLVAVPRWGIEGAALGSALGYGAALAVVAHGWWRLRRADAPHARAARPVATEAAS